jgi:hypothetical protein
MIQRTYGIAFANVLSVNVKCSIHSLCFTSNGLLRQVLRVHQLVGFIGYILPLGSPVRGDLGLGKSRYSPLNHMQVDLSVLCRCLRYAQAAMAAQTNPRQKW